MKYLSKFNEELFFNKKYNLNDYSQELVNLLNDKVDKTNINGDFYLTTCTKDMISIRADIKEIGLATLIFQKISPLGKTKNDIQFTIDFISGVNKNVQRNHGLLLVKEFIEQIKDGEVANGVQRAIDWEIKVYNERKEQREKIEKFYDLLPKEELQDLLIPLKDLLGDYSLNNYSVDSYHIEFNGTSNLHIVDKSKFNYTKSNGYRIDNNLINLYQELFDIAHKLKEGYNCFLVYNFSDNWDAHKLILKISKT